MPRSTLPGIAASTIFENIVRDVRQVGEKMDFKGVVDVQLDLKNSEVSSNGVIVSLFKGSDPKTSSVTIKLATRVHLGDPPA